MSQPCLPVSRRRKRDSDQNADVSFENIQSMDAMEYLRAVVQQANTMPEVFNAPSTQDQDSTPRKNHAPIEGSAASLQYLFSEHTAITPLPTDEHIPANCREWVDGTLANFSLLRGHLEECHQHGVGGKKTERTLVPFMKDRAGWHIFCVGLDEARGNEGSYFDDSDDEMKEEGDARKTDEMKGESDVEKTVEITWHDEVPQNGHSPTVELLLQLDQVMIRQVLSHLSHYAEDGWSISSQRTAWLYALLGRLERPIHRDDAATMYGLLKALTKVRSNTKPDGNEALARINVLICIIGLYFEQGGGFQNMFSC